jgi:hypothetical protein
MTSTEISQKQRSADRKHHEERVAWLSEPHPKYACGTPVNKHDAAGMLQQSKEALADASGMVGLNSCHES